MNRIAFVFLAASFASGAGAHCALAQSLNPFVSAPQDPANAPYVPRTAFFAGLGGSLNSTNFSNQNIYAQGVSDIFQNGALVAFGSAGGPTDPTLNTRTGFSPTVQGGYFQHFPGSNWLWGGRFSYSHIDATSTDTNVLVPQVGSFTSNNSASFTGNVVVRSYQTSINHQMSFVPFVGRSFERSIVYFGAGPTLSQVRSSLNGVIGFAALDGQHLNITGTPSNFSSTPWLFGGAVVVGGTYFLDRSWFVDFSYTYAMTENRTTNFAAPFASATDGYTDTGIISGNYSGRVITQSMSVSINRAF